MVVMCLVNLILPYLLMKNTFLKKAFYVFSCPSNGFDCFSVTFGGALAFNENPEIQDDGSTMTIVTHKRDKKFPFRVLCGWICL